MASTVQMGGGSEKVTIDGEKVKDKLELASATALSLKYAELPVTSTGKNATALGNEIHLFQSNGTAIIHYKWDGVTWTQVETTSFVSVYCVITLNDEIHYIGKIANESGVLRHYKWDGVTWTQVSTVPFTDVIGGKAVLDGCIYIVKNNSQDYYKWDGVTWTKMESLPYYYSNASLVAFNNELYVLGGDTEGGAGSNYAFNFYRRINRSWYKQSDLPYAYSGGSVVVQGSKMHLLGCVSAYNSGGNVRNHYVLQPSRSKEPDLPCNVETNSALVVDDKIHIIGTFRNDPPKAHYNVTPQTVYV